MTNYKAIADALSICMPETEEEAEQDCTKCPFDSSCHGDKHTISFPSALAVAIRNYFSKNHEDIPIQ